MKKTILVIGSTGQQGGSVVRHLLQDNTFAVRALVRDVNSEKAKSLLKQGVSVVQGDLNDVPSLVSAMTNCYGVFGVTNFWDPSVGYDGEVRQTKNIAIACKTTGVQHLVYSTLDRNSDVAHFESKVQGEDYIKSLGVPLTCLVTSFYFENFLSVMKPQTGPNGEVVFAVAQKSTTKVPAFSCYDTGGWVLQAFLHPEKYLGTDVAAVSQYITYSEIVETMAKFTGKQVVFQEIPLEVFRQFGFPGVHELADNLQFFNDISEKNKVDRRVNLTNSQNVYVGETWLQFLERTGFQG
jgi:uncharacterized protein YbjT (DUF2867 family)